MPVYVVTCDTVGREVYSVTADSKVAARFIVESGDVKPDISEVITMEVVAVTERP